MHANKYKQMPIRDNLTTFDMPRFGKPTYIVKK